MGYLMWECQRRLCAQLAPMWMESRQAGIWGKDIPGREGTEWAECGVCAERSWGQYNWRTVKQQHVMWVQWGRQVPDLRDFKPSKEQMAHENWANWKFNKRNSIYKDVGGVGKTQSTVQYSQGWEQQGTLTYPSAEGRGGHCQQDQQGGSWMGRTAWWEL